MLNASVGTEDARFKQLLELCAQPNVWLKLCGANRFMAGGTRYEDIVTVAQALVRQSPSRLIWGTDWPHTDIFVAGKMPNDGDLMNMLMDFVPDTATRNQILA